VKISDLGWDIFAGVVILAAITLLVRPGSAGPDMVTAITDGFSGLIGYATGGLA
jgi:hypothetical protein